MRLDRPSITLVRHGRSSHPAAGWHDAASLERWRDAYDEAGILAEDTPPAALVALARTAGCVAASDLRRARESAARLVAHDVLVCPHLREPHLPTPSWLRVRLPMAGWALVLGTQWLLEGIRRAPPAADVGAQADAAAAWLLERATEHGSVLAVTHGAIRRHVTAALVARGWREPARRSYAHWSAWTLTRA